MSTLTRHSPSHSSIARSARITGWSHRQHLFAAPDSRKNPEKIRGAVTTFKDRYNRDWCLEQLGIVPPLETRPTYVNRKAT